MAQTAGIVHTTLLGAHLLGGGCLGSTSPNRNEQHKRGVESREVDEVSTAAIGDDATAMADIGPCHAGLHASQRNEPCVRSGVVFAYIVMVKKTA